MGDSSPSMAIPLRFADVPVLVQVTHVTVAGSQPTSATKKLAAAYEQAEETIIRITSSVAGTIAQLAKQATSPRQVEVEFGLGVSVEGDIFVVKGGAEATLAITLKYDASS